MVVAGWRDIQEGIPGFPHKSDVRDDGAGFVMCHVCMIDVFVLLLCVFIRVFIHIFVVVSGK